MTVAAIGPYRIEAEIGRGGAGAVFRAIAPDGRRVAVKVLIAAGLRAEHQRRRFRREVDALLRCRHPNVVALVDAGETPAGVPYLVMEWIDGESLQARLEREKRLDPREAAEIVRRLALALEHCHAQGVLHRDLKPANVLARASTRDALLTDFGLARDVDRDDASRLTRTGAWLGTPGYWAPEQARSELDAIGPATDVFGLGALLHALLTGRAPFQVGTLLESLRAHDRAAPAPSSVRRGIPRDLDAIVARCLAVAPADRWPSAGALAEALARFLAHRGAAPSHTRWVAVASVTLLAAALGVVALTSAPASPPQVQRDDLVAEGEKLLGEAHAAWRRREPARARELAERAAALLPGRAEPHVLLALVEFGAGDGRAAFPRAVAAARASPDLRPGSGALLAGLEAVTRGESATALSELERAVALDPQVPEAALALAMLQIELVSPDRAIETAARAIELDPERAYGYFVRGAARASRDDLQGAVADFGRAIELAPGFAAAWGNRGSMRYDMGEAQGAIEDCTQAIALAPREAKVYYNRAMARAQMRDLAGAIEDYTRAHELDPRDPMALLNRGLAHGALGRPEATIEDCTRALGIDPKQAEAWVYRGKARLQTGKYEAALADLLTAEGLLPPGSREVEEVRTLIAKARSER